MPSFSSYHGDVCGVIAVDEKPSIQALERAQGYLLLPDGKAVNGFSHCYKRHGTTTLFAAPFDWKKGVVFPSKLKSKYSDLCR